MRAGLAALILGYVLSQFYRAFLAVLAPVLGPATGASTADLAAASGLWFLAFAAMQLPIGAALDRVGPRRTAGALMAVGAAGAGVMALATGPGGVKLAMVLIGVGCSPVLMASYYIFARAFPAAAFGTLAGATIGVGSLGNLAAALPLTLAVEAMGWRGTMWALAAVTALAAGGVWALVRDPPRVEGEGGRGRLLDLLRRPEVWPVLAMMVVCYAPAAGLRGLWLGPYFTQVHGFTAGQVGTAGLWMGLAMVAGNFAYGPLDRLLGTRKGLILGGNLVTLVALGLLWGLAPGPGVAVALFMAVGFFGASFPMVVAHGRAFFPPHLVGRGVTLLNLFGIAPIGLAQLATGRLHAAAADPAAGHAAVFLFFALALALGLAAYLPARDRTD